MPTGRGRKVPWLAVVLAFSGCREATEPRAPYTIGGHVRVIGYLTNATSQFLGTRVEENADGVPVTLLYGKSAVAETRTVHGEYQFKNVAPGSYTTRATAPGDLSYESRSLVINGSSVYSRDTLQLKSRGDLHPSPNPIVTETWIGFVLAESTQIQLDVCDVEGRLVKRLKSLGYQYPPGFYEMRWDGRTSKGDLAPTGIYWAFFTSGSDLRTQALFRDALPTAGPSLAVAGSAAGADQRMRTSRRTEFSLPAASRPK